MVRRTYFPLKTGYKMLIFPITYRTIDVFKVRRRGQIKESVARDSAHNAGSPLSPAMRVRFLWQGLRSAMHPLVLTEQPFLSEIES